MDTIIFGVSFVAAVGSAAWIIKANLNALKDEIKRVENNNEELTRRIARLYTEEAIDFVKYETRLLRQDLDGVLKEEKRKKNIKICKEQIAAATSQKALYAATLKELQNNG